MNLFIRSLVVAFIAIVTLNFNLNTASAATPEQVLQVIEMMASKKISFLAQKSYEDGGIQAVFVYKGIKYTMYTPYYPAQEGTWLAFWVRKDGTTGQDTMETFSDHNLKGIVDFGIDGPHKRVMTMTLKEDGGKPTQVLIGEENRAYWQGQYDAAIKAALAYKRVCKCPPRRLAKK